MRRLAAVGCGLAWAALFGGSAWAQGQTPQPVATAQPGQNISVDTLQNTPLLAAQQSLMLARARVMEQRYSEAVAPLLTAAEGLDYFAQEVGNPLGQDAGYLRRQIRDYANVVQTDHQDAVIRIDDWLAQIRQWE